MRAVFHLIIAFFPIFSPLSIYAEPAKIMPLADEEMITSLAVLNDKLYAFGERGHFFEWKDELKQLPFPNNLTLTSSVVDDNQLIVVGYQGLIYRREGSEWLKISETEEKDQILFSVSFSDKNRGLAVGSFGLAMATTDGRKWNKVEIVTTGAHMYQVKGQGDGTFYIAGELGTLLKVGSDFGVLQSYVKQGFGEPTYFGLEPINETEFLAYGMVGRVELFSGETSKEVANPRNRSLYASLKNGEDILLVGSLGTILLYRDGQLIDRSIEIDDDIVDAVIFHDKLFLGTTQGIQVLPLEEVFK